MKLQRSHHDIGHRGKVVYRTLRPEDGGGWTLNNDSVVLSQMQPRNLWRFTSRISSDLDAYYDNTYGEMMLKIALVKLRLGV